MSRIGKGHAKLLLLACAALCCLAAAATAQADGAAPPDLVPYCFDGHTESYAPGAWGNLLETTAIPEIRCQADDLALTLLRHHDTVPAEMARQHR